MLKKQFGKNMKLLRVSKGITQQELAILLGVSVGYISNLERGINSPSFDLLERISLKLEVTIRDLFTFE